MRLTVPGQAARLQQRGTARYLHERMKSDDVQRWGRIESGLSAYSYDRTVWTMPEEITEEET